MARKTAAALPLAEEMAWLGQVREVRPPIAPGQSLIVIHRRFTNGRLGPQFPLPCPERHPYCEVTFVLEGRGEQFIGMEKVTGDRGYLGLVGPGIPHYGTILEYPASVIVVHFLPILLFEMGPGGDGARILARFTASRAIPQDGAHPPKALQEHFARQFETMAKEFKQPKFGSEMRLRFLLMDVLIEYLRWEESAGHALPAQPASSHWVQVEAVLRFIYEHYAEPLYIEQIAREVGLSANGLNRLFRETFGMSCVHYLGAYRISQAKSLLCLPDARVTEIAPAVGFETLSHFNAAFRRFQGMSPTEYMRSSKAAK